MAETTQPQETQAADAETKQHDEVNYYLTPDGQRFSQIMASDDIILTPEQLDALKDEYIAKYPGLVASWDTLVAEMDYFDGPSGARLCSKNELLQRMRGSLELSHVAKSVSAATWLTIVS